jgi:hypothetical protein
MNDGPSFPVPLHLINMVDFHAEQAAHKTEGCPACKGTMNLVGDTGANCAGTSARIRGYKPLMSGATEQI